MISLDTNVIVRVATEDDPEQLGIALEVMRSNHLYICRTVLLENGVGPPLALSSS